MVQAESDNFFHLFLDRGIFKDFFHKPEEIFSLRIYHQVGSENKDQPRVIDTHEPEDGDEEKCIKKRVQYEQ